LKALLCLIFAVVYFALLIFDTASLALVTNVTLV
jgi:hypothetical protein